MTDVASLPTALNGQHDFFEVALMLFSIVGLALLPSHGARHRQHQENRIVLAAQRAELGTSQAQQEDNSEHSDPEILLGASEKSTAAGSHAPMFSTLTFVTNFALWIVLAIAFNAYGKTYLRDSHNPVGLVVLQGATGVLVLCVLGGFGVLDLRSGKQLSMSAARGAGLASLFHASQALLTNFAVFVGGVAVTNALKAIEPVAAAIFSYFLLGKGITALRGASLGVIIVGILSLTYKSGGDGSGSGSGSSGGGHIFLSVVFTAGAVCCNAMRNVIIKKGDPIPPHQTLMACSAAATIVGVSLMLVRIVARGIDDILGQGCGSNNGGRMTPFDDVGWIRMAGVKGSLCYVGFQLASFNLLASLSPVGHAVGNSCKRAVVFASGIVLLGEIMSARQLGGAMVALGGVLAYGLAGALDAGPSPVPSTTTAEPSPGGANRYTLGWCLRVCGVRRFLFVR